MTEIIVRKGAWQAAGQQDIGLWAERLTARDFVGRPCLFLDRDGVVVEETHYLHEVENVTFIDGVAAAIAGANRAAIPVVMATNQAGIGHGYYDWDAFAKVQNFILDRFSEEGASIDMVLSCAYHQHGIGAFKVANHPWRKPSSGMLQEAQRALGIDLAQSFIVGDKVSDLKAGRSAGLSCGALTLTGYGKAESASHSALLASWRAQAVFDVRVVENAAMAINEWIQEISTRIAQRKQDAHQ